MANWVVAKFGGSSVKDAQAMLRVSNIVGSNSEIKVVVISATQNTTNQLEFIAQAAQKGDEDTLNSLISELKNRHMGIAHDLFTGEEVRNQIEELIEELKDLTANILKERLLSPKIMDHIYSIGERISSRLIYDLIKLRTPERNVLFLEARDVIKTSSDFQKAEPQIDLIAEKIKEVFGENLANDTLYVTQGFIGEDLLGQITTLGREGSDYSAALFGEAIDAKLVQIWTDVEGIASSDPRYIKEARFISKLSYDEATALASLGAKVLFPRTLLPTKRKNIPVFVGSSLKPELPGTLVTNQQDGSFKLKAVSILDKKEYSIISFIGCHLDQDHELVEGLTTAFYPLSVEYYNHTSVSVSFKIGHGIDKSQVLLKAHEILLQRSESF